ncbi:hypothetical protein [Xanthobacter aminoxidans]|uniref:hypothetical protein n=1 Tax=Xanthobacter aminoxidans TaxID=186280 RepID=UPI002022BFD7|nr:hypothetical protein [Xanthobacter aminoxidans]MCL8385534.1 hypothetical protein [Xanthobacter aminoxidans]
MPHHPNQLNMKEAAAALAALAGVASRSAQLADLIRDFKDLVAHLLPAASIAEAGGGDEANHRLAAMQVDAADKASEILSIMILLAARLAKAGPTLGDVLGDAADADDTFAEGI